MEFLEIPFYDDDLLKMMVRFSIDILVVGMIVGFCYHPHQKSRPYVFTFLLMNVMVFFICFTLKKIDLGLGMALGLFAIFAILRYRTDAIRVKDMTYLFIVVGVAVINSLSNKQTSYIELMFTNVVIIGLTFFLERILLTTKFSEQNIAYDNLTLLHPKNRQALLDDIEQRTGLVATHIKVAKIDLKKATANIIVYYQDDELE
jgi:hypothetical protein